MGETAVEPKTPALARRGRAIGDNGSTKGASDAGALASVDRLSPIDLFEALAERLAVWEKQL